MADQSPYAHESEGEPQDYDATSLGALDPEGEQGKAARSLNSEQVRVGVSGRLFITARDKLAPESALPTDVKTPWDAATWIDCGYLTEDGPSMTPSTESEDIMAWQSMEPVRNIITKRSLEWKFSLMQTNGDILPLVFGGGSVDPVTGKDGLWKYTPPKAGAKDERSFGLEVQDGDVIERYYLRKGTVSDVGDIVFRRNEATRYELTIKSLAPGEKPTWEAISNDPAWGPSSTKTDHQPGGNPTVTKLDKSQPAAQPVQGAVVNVTGSNLTNITTVDLAGIASTPTAGKSHTGLQRAAGGNRDTTVSFTVPANVEVGDYTVTLQPGSIPAGEITVKVKAQPANEAKPASFTPGEGVKGTTVITIKGTAMTHIPTHEGVVLKATGKDDVKASAEGNPTATEYKFKIPDGAEVASQTEVHVIPANGKQAVRVGKGYLNVKAS